MALSDLAVYSEYAYAAMTEVLDQQINVFNASSGGTITLVGASVQGDWSETAFWAKMDGTVRRRNPYGSGAIATKNMKHLTDTMVKVAAGTPEIRLDPGQFRWIQMNPEEAGVMFGRQLAGDLLQDILNIGLGSCYAALAQETAVIYDATATTSAEPTPNNLNNAQAMFGDRSGAIGAWILHSGTMHKLWGNALTNNERLFNYGTVNIMRDPFGRLFVMTDSPSLFDATTSKYHTLGLTSGALILQQNNDFDAMETGKTGDENLIRTYQAEWSYNVGVKGFSWDKVNGGKAPTDAALLTSTNWDRYATSHKDLAGVVLETN